MRIRIDHECYILLMDLSFFTVIAVVPDVCTCVFVIMTLATTRMAHNLAKIDTGFILI